MENVDCIVSLTSWKGRIYHEDVPKAIFSIIKQKTKYKYKIVLVLSEMEFKNKEDELPDIIKLYLKNNLIELLWTKDNLKAFKKLYPTMKKYPNLPILTTDDDCILKDNVVEVFMNKHKENPKSILTESGHWFMVRDEIVTGLFRLYPPHSLFDIDIKYFKEIYFSTEDDAYTAILAKLNGTPTIIMKTGLIQEFQTNIQDNAFRKIYKKISPVKCRENLYNALKKDKII